MYKYGSFMILSGFFYSSFPSIIWEYLCSFVQPRWDLTTIVAICMVTSKIFLEFAVVPKHSLLTYGTLLVSCGIPEDSLSMQDIAAESWTLSVNSFFVLSNYSRTSAVYLVIFDESLRLSRNWRIIFSRSEERWTWRIRSCFKMAKDSTITSTSLRSAICSWRMIRNSLRGFLRILFDIRCVSSDC